MSIIVGTRNDNFLSGIDSDAQIIVGGGNVNISLGLKNVVIDGGDGNDKLKLFAASRLKVLWQKNRLG